MNRTTLQKYLFLILFFTQFAMADEPQFAAVVVKNTGIIPAQAVLHKNYIYFTEKVSEPTKGCGPYRGVYFYSLKTKAVTPLWNQQENCVSHFSIQNDKLYVHLNRPTGGVIYSVDKTNGNALPEDKFNLAQARVALYRAEQLKNEWDVETQWSFIKGKDIYWLTVLEHAKEPHKNGRLLLLDHYEDAKPEAWEESQIVKFATLPKTFELKQVINHATGFYTVGVQDNMGSILSWNYETPEKPVLSYGSKNTIAADWIKTASDSWSVRKPNFLFPTEKGFLIHDGTTQTVETPALSNIDVAAKTANRFIIPSTDLSGVSTVGAGAILVTRPFQKQILIYSNSRNILPEFAEELDWVSNDNPDNSWSLFLKPGHELKVKK